MKSAQRGPRARSLRRRVRDAIALVATLSLLLFGVPLALVLDRLIESQALAALQRDATRAVAAVPDNTLRAGTSLRAPRGTGDTRIGVYDAHGVLLVGRGPARSPLAGRVADQREHDGHDRGDLTVVVPVLSDTTVAGSVRAAVPLSMLRARVDRAWGLLAGLGLVVIAVATALARRAARRISRPFEDITAAAPALGDGRYDMHLPHWGIPEADAAGDALRESARQVDALILHQREFMNDASHQLRTPLAAALLALESQPPQVPAALASIQHLDTTIADLVALRGLAGTQACDPRQVASEAVTRWATVRQPVTLRSDHTGHVALTGAALRQGLEVLLDNAVRHGHGEVTVTVEPYGESVLVEVADQGVGFADDAEPGTGLRLATRIVERAGGSLLVRRRAPHARVALLLPLATGAGPDASSDAPLA